jgi:hypothetical protein
MVTACGTSIVLCARDIKRRELCTKHRTFTADVKAAEEIFCARILKEVYKLEVEYHEHCCFISLRPKVTSQIVCNLKSFNCGGIACLRVKLTFSAAV